MFGLTVLEFEFTRMCVVRVVAMGRWLLRMRICAAVLCCARECVRRGVRDV